jgi:ankyrin repeat protein
MKEAKVTLVSVPKSNPPEAPEVFVKGFKGVNIDRQDLSLIGSVKLGYARSTKRLIDSGSVDVNEQDESGMTALHYAAALGARHCVRVLVNSGKCDYLIKDSRGRYASDLALEWGRDYAVSVLLLKKQVKQAYNDGVSASDKSG